MRQCHSIFIVLALGGALLLVGCNDDEPGDNVDFVTELHLETPDGETRSSFTEGNDAVVVLSVRNRSDDDRTLEFSDERVADFAVLNDDDEIVRVWSSDRSFASVLTEETFPAGETRRFELEWNGLDDDNGDSLSAGDYEIQGWLATDDEDGLNDLSPGPLRSTLVPFTIEAP